MIRQPLQTAARSRLQQRNRSAPVLGLNYSDPIVALKEGYAIRLDNWVCRTDGLHVRPGYEVEVATVGDPVEALIGTGQQVFSCTADTIYDGTSPAVTGCISGDWISATLANPGGSWMVTVNGYDAPRKFGGWQWSEAAIAGVDGQRLFTVCEHQRRLWFAEQYSLNVWYLGLDAVEGPAYPLPMEAQFHKGGYIAAIGSIQPQGGRGVDAKLCIVTTEGELAVYGGSQPDTAGGFKLAGVWSLPKPVGKRAFRNVGGQLAMMTTRGLYSIPALLAEAEGRRARGSISDKIDDAVTGAKAVIESPTHDLTMIDAGDVQWIMSDTGAWSRWMVPATCWGEVAGGLYFGTASGSVCRMGEHEDGVDPIAAYAVDAFSSLKTAHRKTAKRVRPTFKAPHPYRPRMEMRVDYRDPPANFAAANVASGYWAWEDLDWDQMPTEWRRDQSARLGQWRGINGSGFVMALQCSMKTRSPVIWTGYDVEFEEGGPQ